MDRDDVSFDLNLCFNKKMTFTQTKTIADQRLIFNGYLNRHKNLYNTVHVF